MAAASIDLAGLAATLVAEAGEAGADVHGSGAALARAAVRLGPRSNLGIRSTRAADLPGLSCELFAPKLSRKLAPVPHPGPMPPWFKPWSNVAATDEVRLLRIPGGHLLHLAHAPVVLTANADAMVQDCSGRYAPLVNYVAADLDAVVRAARPVPGTVFVLGTEIQPVNYCHWLIDDLPRLHVLEEIGRHRDVTVAVPPLTAAFQRETLRSCGFDDAHVVELGPMQALRSDTLLATNDLPDPPHPAFKASAWALHFLRQRIGGAMANGRGRRLYLSRADGVGRRIVNEAALVAALRPLGVEAETLADKTVREQAALLAGASFVVAPHGAGLANIVFAPPGAGLLELFPRSYGTPAYYLLARGAQLDYAYLLVEDVVPGERAQLDDMRVDVAQVAAKCREMLR